MIIQRFYIIRYVYIFGGLKSMNKFISRKFLACFIALIFLTVIFSPFSKTTPIFYGKNEFPLKRIFDLPDPLKLNISLEEAICRRMSVREFTGEGITNEELSTILWNAYGFNQNHIRNVHGITNTYPITIYLLARCGVWRYMPYEHSLILHSRLDMTWIGQYDTATVKIGLVWDKNKCVDENYAGAEIGEICQNIYFTCNALNLGTVTTAGEANQLYFIGLPINEIPMIIMPIGHPKTPYRFTYDPVTSDLPSIKNSSKSLTEILINRNEAISWEDSDITLQQQTQVIWSSYGYSYYIDEVNNKRHKTVPSSHGRYPLTIYSINRTGVYRYKPESHQLLEVKKGDFRKDIASVSGGFISAAPLMVIPVLNISDLDRKYLWVWYYESAASAFNILLESTAWNLSANIIHITDPGDLAFILGLNSEEWLPMFIIPVGKQKNIENQPPSVTITQPKNGFYFFGNKILDIGRTIIIGPFEAKIVADDDQCFKSIHFYVDGESVKYSNSQISIFCLPTQFILKRKELAIEVFDYEGKSSTASVKYFKIF